MSEKVDTWFLPPKGSICGPTILGHTVFYPFFQGEHDTVGAAPTGAGFWLLNACHGTDEQAPGSKVRELGM